MKPSTAKPRAQKARVCICVRYKGELLKLTWINEDSKGVYVGFYGIRSSMHFSYHVDGTTHFKGPGGKRLFEPNTRTPIASITKMDQLNTSAITLEHEDAVSVMTLGFEGDKDAHCVFIGGEEIESSVVNVSVYIVHRTWEAEFARSMYGGFPHRPELKLVGFVTLPLTNFPDHKVALMVVAVPQPARIKDLT